MNNRTVLYCDCLAPELERILARDEFSEIVAVSVPGECDRPRFDDTLLAEMVEQAGGTFPALLFGGECIVSEEEKPDVERFVCYSLHDCMAEMVGAEWLEQRMAAGDHVSTVGQIQHWRDAYQRWGFDEQSGRDYFAESTRRLILLDSGLIAGIQQEFAAFAAKIDRAWEVRTVNPDALYRLLSDSLEKLSMDQRIDQLEASRQDAERRLADYAMIIDLTGAMTAFTEEQAVLERLLEIFSMLCAPSQVVFRSRRDGSCVALPPYPAPDQKLCDGLGEMRGSHQAFDDGSGFAIAIERGGERFGVVIVENVAFPQQLQHYLNLALNLAPVLGLALSNAHTYQQRLAAEAREAALNDELKQQLNTVNMLNKELESFTYSVSHDLRAPLRSLDGFSHILERDYPEGLDDRGRHFLGRIRANAQRMGQLIDDLLRLSRLTRGELAVAPLDLGEIARELADDLLHTEPERQVEVVITEPMPAIGDARLLRAVFDNLIGNAWKYTSKREKARIEIGIEGDGEDKYYYIRDNGAGFDMAYAEKLFAPFQRLHSEEEFAGTGIGLATVQRIIQRHGGKVWAQSIPDQGATFYFTLSS